MPFIFLAAGMPAPVRLSCAAVGPRGTVVDRILTTISLHVCSRDNAFGDARLGCDECVVDINNRAQI